MHELYNFNMFSVEGNNMCINMIMLSVSLIIVDFNYFEDY